MSESNPSKREIRTRGAHSEKLGKTAQDQAQTTQESPEKNIPAAPTVEAYFRERDLPTDVWVPTGTAYYNTFEDVPMEDFRHRISPPKIASLETRAAVALQVCPLMEGESPDASFRFGARGLYVKVIKGYKESTVGGIAKKEPVLAWIPFNEEDTDPRKVRRI